MTAVFAETGAGAPFVSRIIRGFPERITRDDPQPALQIVRKKWIYIILDLLKAPSMTTSAEAAAMVQATARLQVTDIRDRKPGAALPGPASKAARCPFTEDFPREASPAVTPKIS